MRTDLLDPCTDDRWEDFVGRAEGATMFHHPRWLRLLAARYRYRFEAACLLDDSGRVVAGLPWGRIESRLTGKRLVAVPFSDACPPLTDGAPEGDLARAVEEHRQRDGLGLEVRWGMDSLPGAVSVHRYWRHTLALEADADAVAKRARSGIRRGAKKALREGLRFERRTDQRALDAFYRLHLQTRKHQGVPTQSKRFIDGFVPLFDAGHGFVALVYDGDRAIAAAVFLQHGEHLIYKYGASDRAALARRPNNLLFAEVIRWGCESGCRELDFGRTDLHHDGLREFKLGWGTDESPLHHTYAGMEPPGEGESRPQRLLEPVIRHSPASVSRMIGVALYRHFG
jgi:CelD/BcsL family acetyltransferase involved in cellulose biosynthesis